MGGRDFEFDFTAGDGCRENVDTFAEVVIRFFGDGVPVEEEAVGFDGLGLGAAGSGLLRVVVAHREDQLFLKVGVEREVDFGDRG